MIELSDAIAYALPVPSPRATPGYFGPHLVAQGKLSGRGDLVIDGRFEGGVDIEGALTVAAQGVLLATTSVTDLIVDGHVKGNVFASDAVAVREGGRLDGDVRARRVSIDDGGVLQGGIEMDFEVPAGLDPRDLP